MAPTPEEHYSEPVDGTRRIVISGMAGLYPQAQDIADLEKILYNKINPITSDDLRWQFNHPEASQYAGNVPNIDRFDGQFFKVHFRMANHMDPMSRMLLEQAYAAIYDAGINPLHLSGKKVAVFIGSCFSESEKKAFYVTNIRGGLGLSGSSRTMFANRISYWLNIKGPSLSIDESSCSSLGALEQAYQAIARGECEAAIVGGTNICLHPQTTVHDRRIMKTTTDGKTKSFAQDAAGCLKTEAINVLFLQEAKHAKRIYAEIVHVKSDFMGIQSDETGPIYGFYRNPDCSGNFLKQFYDEAGVSPNAVEYVEAFGSAVPDADKSELEAIDNVFCQNRTEPLPVGSVMSNIGYGEAASGISGITKVLLGYHKGELAGNLHCDTPRQDVEALQKGRIKILTRNQRFQGTYTAVNGLSVTGINAHVLLRAHHKPKDTSRYSSSIPRLVTISARQDESVKHILDYLKWHPIDSEELSLLHNIHENNIPGHLGRGFTILDSIENKTTISLCERAEYFDDAQRPLWFVYSGMGSQWTGMGAQLMRIPIFAAAIERCRKTLEPKGIDVTHIITSTDKTMFDNILHSFVGIAAVQIGLTDVMLSLGLVPDKIIGHSVGELGCAYADGCLTAEEMILAAYSRGRVSLETPFIRGSMAAVGIGYQQMSEMCPPEIQVACHNSADSCTISGPADAMRSFVNELTSKGIFAREVPCSNIAYHSRYIADAGPTLLRYLKEVIPNPKTRSERWLSTSVPQNRWGESIAKYCSAEYHTNNLLSPVLFEETSKLIPENAVVVEVAPHGLLQAILKRSLPESCVNIPLTRRSHQDNVLMLLEAVGKLYVNGYNPKVRVLYPTIEYPVSTGTPFLSHLVKWAHEEKWDVPMYETANRKVASSRNILVSLHNKEHESFKGHVIRGETLVPFSFVLVATWDTLAMTMDVPKKSINVQFRDIKLYTQPILRKQKIVRISISINRGTGWFEIMNENSKVATGFITLLKENPNKKSIPEDSNVIKEYSFCNSDVYKFLYERQYAYSGAFRSIHGTNESMNEANIVWEDNWVTFLDGLFQMNTLHTAYNGVSQLDRIGNIIIDVDEHLRIIQSHQSENNDSLLMKAQLFDVYNRTRCNGVTIENIQFYDLPAIWNPITKDSIKCSSKYSSSNDKSSSHECNSPGSGNVTLQSDNIGNLDTLRWVPAPKMTGVGTLVKVHYAGINVGDVKRALGVTNRKEINSYGMEFSGLTDRGDKVMGIMSKGAASSEVLAQPELMWPVPSHWTLEDAATVPFAYMYAYYCLEKTSIKNVCSASGVKQFTVLVHGGAGALGQAVISIALARGYKVFTTVSDLQKKRFLMRLFPQLKEDHIGNSRDASFSDLVLTATGHEKCNLVVCCLKKELKPISIKCCGMSSKLCDTVQILNNENYSFGMKDLLKELSYIAIDIASLLNDIKSPEIKVLHGLVSDGIVRGEVRPLSRVSYSACEVTRAFRLLAASRHRGRVLLRLNHTHATSQHYSTTCTTPGTHIVLCDEQPLGLQLTEKLIVRGEKMIHLHFLKLPSQVQNYKIRVWNQEAKVTTSHGELNNLKDVVDMFNNAKRLATVEGLYVAADNFIQTNILTNINLAINQLNLSLRHLLIVSTNSVNLERSKGLLPAYTVMLDISKLSSKNELDLIWHNGGSEAAVQALQYSDAVLVAHPSEAPRLSLIQQIAAITDLNIQYDDTAGSTTLSELGMESEKSAAVSAYLKDVHNTYIDEEAIPALKLEEIKNIENRNTEVHFKETKGLDSFYSYVDSDELMATTDIVFLPSLANNSTLRDDEFNVNEINLCIVPGLEGHHSRFRTLCEGLKLPALVMQPGLDRPEDTPRDVALRYAHIMLKNIVLDKLNKPFYILGYEAGVIIALELASILEEHGLVGTVFCLGDGPEEIKDILAKELGEFKTEEELQSGVIRHMFALMAAGAAVPDSVFSWETWSERVDACVRALLGRVPHSAQYARSLLQAAYARIGAARRHSAAPRPLRSRLVLLRATHAPATRHRCSLQRYSPHALPVRSLSVPIQHATYDLSVPSIINSYLDTDILDAFEKKNLCDSYLVNPDSFMKSG